MNNNEIPVTYDVFGRMQYHPDFHPNHGSPWKTTEQKYLIERYVLDGPEQGDWLCSQSYRAITEVKKAWYGLL
ncbi:hypothetical protein [Aeromonas salmonicida]|nr:hypothetical protein [Aeromonas salmonicida]QOI95755.1 hypothetical protein G7042_07490 [Aeromonas salmonicida subsp. masoucida]